MHNLPTQNGCSTDCIHSKFFATQITESIYWADHRENSVDKFLEFTEASKSGINGILPW